MQSDILKKLEDEHGINPTQGQGILNTIAQHIKQQFPMVGGMLDKFLGNNASQATTNNSEVDNTSSSPNESSLQHLEDLAKNKLAGLF